VCKDHNPKHDYHWSESEATIEFANPKTGTSAIARPKCLWIDKADKQGAKAADYQGFQVHIIDFKLDNSTWAAWRKIRPTCATRSLDSEATKLST
jgi:hypothetical protein